MLTCVVSWWLQEKCWWNTLPERMKIESDIILFTGRCSRTQPCSGFSHTLAQMFPEAALQIYFFSSLKNIPVKWGRVGDTFQFISLNDFSSVKLFIWVLSAGSEQWRPHPKKSLPHLRLMLRQGDTNPLFFPFFFHLTFWLSCGTDFAQQKSASHY